jgi:squalene cyclase
VHGTSGVLCKQPRQQACPPTLCAPRQSTKVYFALLLLGLQDMEGGRGPALLPCEAHLEHCASSQAAGLLEAKGWEYGWSQQYGNYAQHAVKHCRLRLLLGKAMGQLWLEP